jgi:dihydroxy-acid dehydratase
MFSQVEAAGGKAFVHYPIVISDGETNGTPGMKYSLLSREVIADSIEVRRVKALTHTCTPRAMLQFFPTRCDQVMHEGYLSDAIITLGGCDKSVCFPPTPLPPLSPT